jgi:hypothetical protein
MAQKELKHLANKRLEETKSELYVKDGKENITYNICPLFLPDLIWIKS